MSLRIVLILIPYLNAPAFVFMVTHGHSVARFNDPNILSHTQSGYVPARATKRVEANRPDGVRLIGGKSRVIIEITVDETGEVINARLYRGGSEALRNSAMHAVLQWKFDPAKHNDVPVKALGVVTFNFTSYRKPSTSRYTFSFRECCPMSKDKSKRRSAL